MRIGQESSTFFLFQLLLKISPKLRLKEPHFSLILTFACSVKRQLLWVDLVTLSEPFRRWKTSSGTQEMPTRAAKLRTVQVTPKE